MALAQQKLQFSRNYSSAETRFSRNTVRVSPLKCHNRPEIIDPLPEATRKLCVHIDARVSMRIGREWQNRMIVVRGAVVEGS